MKKIEEILKSNLKPKEKVVKLANEIKNDKTVLSEVVDCFNGGSTADKGNCIEAIELVTEERPETLVPYLDFIVEQINHDAPRVKWESARAIGNMAKYYSDKLIDAIPKLLMNTTDSGTVVRWSAAQALTEIAKYNSKIRNELIVKFNGILKKEDNAGVKNVYKKALKFLENKK
jgi:ribosomal 30S subunit maturation factor RimM